MSIDDTESDLYRPQRAIYSRKVRISILKKTGLFDLHIDKLHQEHVGRENGKLRKS